MINSLFMLGSSYNRNRIVSTAFLIGWIAYMFIESDLSLGLTFPIVNAIVFIIISVLINLIKDRKANTIFSIFSILIWSISIDIICYFIYPTIVGNQNIFEYVFQGILFNSRYIFTNTIAIGIIYILDYAIKKVKQKLQSRKNYIYYEG